SFLQLLSRDGELHPSRRPFPEFCGVRLYYSTRIELLVVVVEDGEMWVVGLNWCPAQQLASRRHAARLLGLLVSRAFPTSPCASHTRPHRSFPDVGYSADNSWRAISTRSLNVRSRISWRSTLSTEWITVEWSRPPNACPISTSCMPSMSRARYIATCRGTVRVLARAFERSPSGVTPQRRATTSCTRSTLGVGWAPYLDASSPCRILSESASRASSIVTSRFSSEAT